MKPNDVFVMYMTACLGWKFHPGYQKPGTQPLDITDVINWCLDATQQTYIVFQEPPPWQPSQQQQ
jgi:hypothetical protein